MTAAAADWKQMILDHYKKPRFFGEPSNIWLEAEEHNRTCGDHIKVYVTASRAGHGNFCFSGAGCSLCIASASLMCSLLQEVDASACQVQLQQFQKIWTEGLSAEAGETWQLFNGLRQYPVRSRCVRLPWQALEKIIAAWPSQGIAPP